MGKNKLVIFFIATIVIFLFIFIGLILYNLFFPPAPNPIDANIPTPTYPTGATNLPTGGPDAPLDIVSISPLQDTTGGKKYGPGQIITFTFNKDLDPQKIFVSSSPEMELKLAFGANPRELTVLPTFGWDPNTLYTITIKKGTTAIDGSELKADIQYKIFITTDYLNQGV